MTGYSRQPQVVDTARRFLIRCAQDSEGHLPTYGDVAAVYGGIARAVGPVLNSIRRDCDAAKQPDLTALVVDRRTRLPGTFRGEGVVAGAVSERQWRDELSRIRSFEWPDG